MKIVFDDKEEFEGTVAMLANQCCPENLNLESCIEHCCSENCCECWSKALKPYSEVADENHI